MFLGALCTAFYFSKPFMILTTDDIVASSALRPNTQIPPLLHRVGFSAVFGGAAYVLSTGDARNGSGIATGSLTRCLVLSCVPTLVNTSHFSVVIDIPVPELPKIAEGASTSSPPCYDRCCDCLCGSLWNGILLVSSYLRPKSIMFWSTSCVECF
jgi:hypothetical protein